MKRNNYLTFVMDLLQPHGPIKARSMFGGYGIYYADTMFACIVEDELYFRIDDETKGAYEELGSKPFVYEGMKKPVTMPYYRLPEEILENSELLAPWIETAHKTALKYKKARKVTKKKTE